jgi:hypothetical protein
MSDRNDVSKKYNLLIVDREWLSNHDASITRTPHPSLPLNRVLVQAARGKQWSKMTAKRAHDLIASELKIQR